LFWSDCTNHPVFRILQFFTKTACLYFVLLHILSLNKAKQNAAFITKRQTKTKDFTTHNKEEINMSNRSSNRAVVPEAKSALDRFKYEVASEIGVPLKDGYNGDLTSRQNGSVGGYMVKKMIEAQEKQMSGK
jgi:hypothetical protein